MVVDPSRLFCHYTYRSSISRTFVRHCRQMARAIRAWASLGEQDLVVDVAGNDGALLNEFREELGVRVLNVEPAGNIAAVASSRGIETINDFWSTSVAETIVADHGRPKMVTATNVFAHVDDVRGFLQAVKYCLAEDGALVLEFPYLVDLIEHREFDTIYFEHLSYFAIKPVIALAQSLDMTVFHVEKQDIHGGTVRVLVAPNGDRQVSDTVPTFLAAEREGGFHDLAVYRTWAQCIDRMIDELSGRLRHLKESGARIAAFGASAKGNTLLNACRIHPGILDFIVDDTPEKIGKFSPGTGIPIVHRSRLRQDKPDYLLILAWNFVREIMENTAEYGRCGGKYILPVPEFTIVE